LQADRHEGTTQIFCQMSHPFGRPNRPRPFHLLLGPTGAMAETWGSDDPGLAELARHGAGVLAPGEDRLFLPHPSAQELLDEGLFLAAASPTAQAGVRRWRHNVQQEHRPEALMLERTTSACFVLSEVVSEWYLEAGTVAEETAFDAG